MVVKKKLLSRQIIYVYVYIYKYIVRRRNTKQERTYSGLEVGMHWRKCYLEAVVGPRTELEYAGLLVEGEVLDVDFTGGLVYRRWLPLDQALVVDGGLRGQGHLEVSVRAASEHISGSGRCGGRESLLCTFRLLSAEHADFNSFRTSFSFFFTIFVAFASLCSLSICRFVIYRWGIALFAVTDRLTGKDVDFRINRK